MQHRLTHSGLGPDRFQDLVFGDQLARLRQQATEDRKRFRVQREHLMAAPQPFVAPVQSTPIERPAMGGLQSSRLLRRSHIMGLVPPLRLHSPPRLQPRPCKPAYYTPCRGAVGRRRWGGAHGERCGHDRTRRHGAQAFTKDTTFSIL
jgi:hypothetical protein